MLYALNSVHCLLSDIICTCAHSIRLELSCWPFFTSYLIPIILKLIILPSAHHLYHLPSCVFNPKIILTISKFTSFRVFTTNCSVCNLKWENGTFTSNQFNLCGFNRSFSASSIFDQKLSKRSISTAHHWKLFTGIKKLKMLAHKGIHKSFWDWHSKSTSFLCKMASKIWSNLHCLASKTGDRVCHHGNNKWIFQKEWFNSNNFHQLTTLINGLEVFNDRPCSFLYMLFSPDKVDGDGIILSRGDRHRAERKFAHRALTQLGMGKKALEASVHWLHIFFFSHSENAIIINWP